MSLHVNSWPVCFEGAVSWWVLKLPLLNDYKGSVELKGLLLA